MLIYVALSFSSFNAVGSTLQPLLFAIFLVPLGYWNQAANAVVSGHRPAVLGYALIVSEICKIAVAAPLLLIYRTGINGVILALMVSYFSQALVSSYMVRDASSDPVDLALGKRWLSKAWLPSLLSLPYVLSIADTFAVSVLSRGTDLTAYYQAAFSIASIAGYSFYLASALYPLLLRGGSDELISSTLDIVLLFGLPMAAGAGILAQPILALLKSQYVASSTGLAILAVAALVLSVSMLFDQTMLGREKADVDGAVTFAKLVKSDLLFVSLINIAMSGVYLIATGLLVYYGLVVRLSISQIVNLWGAAQLVVYVIFTIVKFLKLRRTTKVHLKTTFVRYLIATFVMAAVLETLSIMIPVSSGTLGSGVRLSLVALAGVLAYFGALYAIDGSFRGLLASFRKSIL
jgi:hypothetical protein